LLEHAYVDTTIFKLFQARRRRGIVRLGAAEASAEADISAPVDRHAAVTH